MNRWSNKLFEEMLKGTGKTPEQCKNDLDELLKKLSLRFNLPKENFWLDWDAEKQSLKIKVGLI
jgi:hypothetical protein